MLCVIEENHLCDGNVKSEDNVYIFSFLKHLFRPSNIGIIIFFCLNAFMVVGMFAAGGQESLTLVITLYILSIVISLSSIGEWFLGLMSGARKMTRLDMRNRILPLVQRVYDKAIAKTPDMTKVINIKVMYDPNPNAFALGRHTICVTEGLFTSLPDEMIEGILAHEIAHLACHHTDAQLLIGGGNCIVTFFITVMKLISGVITFIGSLFMINDGTRKSGCGCLFSLFGLLVSGIVWLWTKFCMLFLMWSSRANEYAADKYAMEIGYGYELAAALDTIGTGVPQSSLLKALYSTHPETNDRIGRLQAMGVPYSRY